MDGLLTNNKFLLDCGFFKDASPEARKKKINEYKAKLFSSIKSDHPLFQGLSVSSIANLRNALQSHPASVHVYVQVVRAKRRKEIVCQRSP